MKILIPMVLIAGAMVFIVVRRTMQMKHLVRHGTVGQGKVIKTFRRQEQFGLPAP